MRNLLLLIIIPSWDIVGFMSDCKSSAHFLCAAKGMRAVMFRRISFVE